MKYMLLIYSATTTDGADQCEFEDWVVYDKAVKEAGILVDGHSLKDLTTATTVRADLLCRLGRFPEAAAAYREALDLAGTEPERAHLRRRLGAIATPGPEGTTAPGDGRPGRRHHPVRPLETG